MGDRDEPFHNATVAAQRLRGDLGLGDDQVDVAVVCGSGLGGFLDALDDRVDVAMGATYRFPAPTVPGHTGRIAAGTVGANRVLVLAGRAHLYEGHPVDRVVHGVRTAAALGAHTVVLTNAAGSLRTELEVGALVSISDHLNLTGHNPLMGRLDDDRSRFVDLSAAYDPDLRGLAVSIDASMRSGVYACFCGPSYETPAEVAMAGVLGADLVGMSTVCETIAARHAGMTVAAFSLVTNQAAGLGAELSHGEVADTAAAAQESTVAFLSEFVAAIPRP
jgi:purine-nucleoside phosphorylase